MSTADYETPTRDSYDAIAQAYTDWVSAELTAKPHDRAVLGAFAELVLATGHTEAIDLGCGPGRITAFLTGLGLDATGLDLSPEMIAQASQLYSDLSFTTGSMTCLPYPENSFSGALAWYSLIHIPDDRLDRVIAEAARVLRPGGYFQLAFQLGDWVDHFSDLAGYDVDLDFHRRSIDDVVAVLTAHGFSLVTRMEREPDTAGRYPESTPQGYVLVRLETSDRLGEDHY